MAKRVYRLEPQEFENEPDWIKHAGQLVKMSGVLLQGSVGGKRKDIILLLPTALGETDREKCNSIFHAELFSILPTLEEWAAFIARTDSPLIFEQDETGLVKAIHRKHQMAISGAIQQQIWVRDQCRCMYCGQPMGKVQLTVDHFVPLEHGGANDTTNYLSACRACNKAKGDMTPENYCAHNGLDYAGLEMYLQGRLSASFIDHLS